MRPAGVLDKDLNAHTGGIQGISQTFNMDIHCAFHCMGVRIPKRMSGSQTGPVICRPRMDALITRQRISWYVEQASPCDTITHSFGLQNERLSIVVVVYITNNPNAGSTLSRHSDGAIDRRKILDMPSLIEIEGVGPSLAAARVKTNYRTIAKIAAATPKGLASVPGISEKSAPQVIASAKLLLAGTSIQKTTTKPRATAKKKRRAVPAVKVATKATTAKAKTKAASTDKAKAKPIRKTSKKPSTNSSETGKKMSASDGKDKIKKLKKKIKKLKEEKRKILKKESKKIKKEKAKKSSKKK